MKSTGSKNSDALLVKKMCSPPVFRSNKFCFEIDFYK